jgi:hypothetical protein
MLHGRLGSIQSKEDALEDENSDALMAELVAAIEEEAELKKSIADLAEIQDRNVDMLLQY